MVVFSYDAFARDFVYYAQRQEIYFVSEVTQMWHFGTSHENTPDFIIIT